MSRWFNSIAGLALIVGLSAALAGCSKSSSPEMGGEKMGGKMGGEKMSGEKMGGKSGNGM